MENKLKVFGVKMCIRDSLYHLLINNRFQFRSNDFPTPRTTVVIQPFRTAKVLLAGGIEDAHNGIPAVPAFDFSRQPCMGGFPGRLDFHVVHQLLTAGCLLYTSRIWLPTGQSRAWRRS